MRTLGIDVAKRRHVATLLDEAGKRTFKNFSFANSHEGFESLRNRIQAVGVAADNLLVGMGSLRALLDDPLPLALRCGFSSPSDQSVGDRSQTKCGYPWNQDRFGRCRTHRAYYARGGPQILRRARRPHASAARLDALRFECAQTLVAEKQRLIALLDLVFPEYAQHFCDIFGAASREVLSQFPTAKELVKVDVRRLTRILKESR